MRERNTRLYRLAHWPIWIWVFFLAPGPLTFTLFAHGFGHSNLAWLALVLLGTGLAAVRGKLPGSEPRPYILRFDEDKPNPLYRRVCYTFAWNAVLNFALLNLSGLVIATVTGVWTMKPIYNYAYAPLCAAMAVLGSLIGTAAFFDVMQRGGEKLLARYTSSERGARFRRWFQRYGLVTVFIPALVPLPFLPFKAFAACAGAMSVNRWRFLCVLAVGRLIRYSGLAYLGVKLGTVENSKAWVKAHTWHMVAVAVGICLVVYLLMKFMDREPVES